MRPLHGLRTIRAPTPKIHHSTYRPNVSADDVWNVPSPAAHAPETIYMPSGQYEARKCMSWKVRERIRRPNNDEETTQ